MSRQNRANRSFLALRRHTLASPRRTNPTGATSPNETCIRAASRRLSPPRMKNVALRAAAWLLEKTNPLWQPAKENKGVASRRQSIFGRSQSARTALPNEPTGAAGARPRRNTEQSQRAVKTGQSVHSWPLRRHTIARLRQTNPIRAALQNDANPARTERDSVRTPLPNEPNLAAGARRGVGGAFLDFASLASTRRTE
jgi:hypothetical protein